MHWSLRSQRLAFLIPLLALLALASVALGIAAGLLATSDSAETSHAVLSSLETLENQAQAADAARRGFIASAKESYLTTYRSAASDLPNTLAKLRARVAQQRQHERLKQLEQQVALLLQLIQDDVELHRKHAIGADRDRAKANQVEMAMDRLRAMILDMNAIEMQSLTDLRLRSDKELRDLNAVLWAALALGILLLLVFVQRYGRRRADHHSSDRRRRASDAPAASALGSPLGDFGRLLQSGADYEAVFQVVQRGAPVLFPQCGGVLYLSDDSVGSLRAKTSWGRAAASKDSFGRADCWALRRGEAHFSARASASACPHLDQPLAAASLCVPIKAQGSVLGIFLLSGDADAAALDSELARAVADQIGSALANIRMQESLHELSVHDAVTGLFNRRYMEESLKREIATAQRKSRTLGVAICEVDRYERINGEFGQQAGDFALREIAQLINTHIRASDIACRYGAGRIALVFPEAPLDAVVMRSNQLREAIAALNLEHFGRSLGKVCVSFGVALFPLHGKTAAELLRQAEAALGSATVAGGDRVELALSAGANS